MEEDSDNKDWLPNLGSHEHEDWDPEGPGHSRAERDRAPT